jgi:hypothetical protein
MADWYPYALAELVPWHANFAAQATTNGTSLGLVAAQVTQIGTDSDNVAAIVNASQAADDFAKAVTAFRETMFSNEPNLPLPTPPAPPGIIVLPLGSLASIEARTRHYANIIKSSPAYTTDDGVAYGIVSAAPSPPGTPSITVQAQPASIVRVSISKAGYSLLAVDSKRDGGAWEQIGVSQTAVFMDDRPPLVAGTSEVREYRVQGMVSNVRTGPVSAVASASTIP